MFYVMCDFKGYKLHALKVISHKTGLIQSCINLALRMHSYIKLLLLLVFSMIEQF